MSEIKNLKYFEDWQKVIVSSDKDFYQLLDDKTVLIRPVQKETLNKNNIYLFDMINFQELKSLVNLSKIVITPHTSVTHIASAYKKIIFDVYNEKDSAKKMLLEYGPIYSKYEFFCFNEKNDLNKSIVSKLKKYKLD